MGINPPRVAESGYHFPRARTRGPAIETTLLFVYGTLKRGLRNHHLMAGQRFVAEAVTEPRYRVVDLGPYPGLVNDPARGLAVRGELWVIDADCLAALDAFEGVPELFARGPVVVADAGQGGPVYAYFWNQPVPVGAASGDRWPMHD